MERIKKFFKDDEGATMPEYAMMIALIAVFCIAAVTAIGGAVNTQFTNAATAIGT